jgi:hypothetical protein
VIRSAIDFNKVVPIQKMHGDDAEDTSLLQGMHREARRYLTSFKWCGGIDEEFFGFGVGGIVAVFLFKIRPRANADAWLWVIVGDLPPAYLVTDLSPSPGKALNQYIKEMRRWVRAVEAGKAISDVIPVNAPPTKANAKNLKSRLDFLKTQILT